MDLTMPQRDDLTTLLNSVIGRLDRLDRKMDEQTIEINKIHLQTQRTNGRVNQHDKDIARLEVSTGKKRTPLEPRTLYLLALAAVIALFIVASVLQINVGGLL